MFVVRTARLAMLSLLAAGVTAHAQGPAATQATASAPSTPSSATAGGRRPITPTEIRNWNSIRQNALSNDGKWFAYVVSKPDSNATLVLRGTAKDAAETRIPVGNGGGSIAFSGDSKWLGFIVAPPRPASAGRGGLGGAAGGRGGQRDTAATGGGQRDTTATRGVRDSTRTTADSTPPARAAANKLVLLNLATGQRREFDRIRTFRFNADTATWIAMHGYPANAAASEPAPAGGGRGGAAAPPPAGGGGGAAGLLLYDIATGELINMGVVAEYAFSDEGEWLAYTMSSPDQVGNAVQVKNMKTHVVRALESERVVYRHLAWIDSSRAIGVMRGRIEEGARDTVFSIAAFTGIGPNGAAKKLVFDPSASREDFPVGWKLASDRAPRYADDMSAVFFGIREANRRNQPVASRGSSPIQPGAPGAGGTINQTQGRAGGPGANGSQNGADEDPTLILWHGKDPRLQSQQIVQEQADRSFNYLASYRFADDSFVRLADDRVRNVTVTPGDRHAYGTDNSPYQQQASYSGRNFVDLYTIDLRTGTRKLIATRRPPTTMVPSPDGTRVLYWGTNGHWWVLNLATGDSVNITRGVATNFANVEDDHNNLYPPAAGSRGWSRDGSAVLLYDGWDVWKVPARPGAEPARNLTGDGRRNQIRYRQLYSNWTESSAGGRGGGAGTRGIDLSKPLYVGTYGEWTKKEGLSRIDPGQPGAKRLFFEDARFSITKARDAETYVYTRQTFTEYPNHWVFNPGFEGGYRITDINPQIKELAWSSGARLIDYRSDKGDRLQGALYLPADHQPGRKYPLLVTIYEKRSQNLHGFVSPSETRTPDPALYTSRGYAVLDPDIVYKINDPGMSAVWSVIPAVKAAIATGLIDEKNIGLWGHSWGGYQTAFLVTQTNLFKAAIAGAALTDMVSMYSSVYWNTGGTNQAIFESSQGRFKGNFIDNYDAYIRNSPAFHANKVKTPLMLLHNDKDGAVDFNQGITFFNTLRQLGKDVILLEYVGENHGLSRPVNQRDYAGRMAEYFDHHLKGAPPADWIREGVPRLKMQEHLQQRRDSTARVIIP